METWHDITVREALQRLRSSENGLAGSEAANRLQEHGYNELRERKAESALAAFARQFKNFLIIILVIAAAISLFLGEMLDASAILALVFVNALIGFVQERRAERALAALKKLAAPLARVLRDGIEAQIPARGIVPGDVLLLEAGDRVPCDCRLIEAHSVRADESALTGESVGVEKHADALRKKDALVAERSNMAFASTLVTYGRAKALAVATGMRTEIGRIAETIQEEKEAATPLQARLERLGKQLGVIFLAVSALIFAEGILRGGDVMQMFLTAVSLAVAAIPEGLPAIVVIALAIGLQRMAKRNAIIRRLPAVETLGCATVICSDKTGTLTRNEMTVRKIYAGNRLYGVSGEGYEPKGAFTLNGRHLAALPKELRLLLGIGALCNNASLREIGGRWAITGDSTEAALLTAAAKAGMWQKELEKTHRRVAELPFDSERKRMSVVIAARGRFAYVKGAPESVLERCDRVLLDGKAKKLDKAARSEILARNRALASGALRTLAFAYKPFPDAHVDERCVERGLIFVGIAGMIDPPREEAKRSVALCRQAGIRAVMITGDHRDTAVAIARELGILNKDEVITGEELERMGDAQLERHAQRISVYARVSPQHKMRIVKALQKTGSVVAMTGDGVNDAPALKAADIGVAMGITGTDVSKEAAAAVLLDDNFATIVAAVEEGRKIYDNIKKSVLYLLSCNIGEVLVMFLSILANLPLPLLPLQILWMNLVTDGLPALALGVDPASNDVMRQKPRSPGEQLLTRRNMRDMAFFGGIMAVGTLLLFALALPDEARSRTIALTTLVFFQLWFALSVRTHRSMLSSEFFANPKLLLAVACSALLQLAIVYLPLAQPVFKTVALSANELLLALAASASIFVVAEARKLLKG